ncbi:MAG: hypothetical protein ABJM06_01580 [Gilvibacter sp.]
MRGIITLCLLLISVQFFAQVGIGTTNPEGALDVVTTNNTGFVMPRVTTVDAVTDGNGNPPVDGTMVFDTTLGMPCVYTNGKWACFGFDSSGAAVVYDGTPPPFSANYIKASNTDAQDQFGNNVFLSSDGTTMAIAAPRERSAATGIDGDQTSNLMANSGAVYIFINTAGTWSQQAYLKASNTGTGDFFGRSIGLSGDGNTLVVGAHLEDSNATGIGGSQTDNSAANSGAVYIFDRSGTTWSQTAYVKASNTEAGDRFGQSVDISADGNTIAVGAPFEPSNATGIGGDQTNNLTPASGAVFIFTKTAGVWSQQEYIKSSNSENGDFVGGHVSISSDGNTLLVGANGEDGNTTGVNGIETDNSFTSAGAAYVFSRSGTTWSQQAYLKQSNTEAGDFFGYTVTLSDDGNTAAIAAPEEDSAAFGIDGVQTDNSAIGAGAVYVFVRVAGVWSQDAYVKASNTNTDDTFSSNGIALSDDGSILIVGAYSEDSSATGIDGVETDNTAADAGAAYVYQKSGTWSQLNYVKASNTDAGDGFGGYNLQGYNLVSMNNDGSLFIIGAPFEASNATGIGGDQANNAAFNAGAVYVFD